jgi:hypothetical protein
MIVFVPLTEVGRSGGRGDFLGDFLLRPGVNLEHKSSRR